MTQSKANEPSQDKLERILHSNFLAVYINLCLQGLISFGMAVMFGFLLRFIWKDIPIWLILPITFVLMIIFSIALSKRLSKIQVGFKIQNWYFNLLKKYM